MQGDVATTLERMYGSRKIKNMIYARATSLFNVFAKLGLPTQRLRDHILCASTSRISRQLGRRRPLSVPASAISKGLFNQTFSKLQHSQFQGSFHPLLLVSIPFQTNKINIRLSVKSLLRASFTSQRQLCPRGRYTLTYARPFHHIQLTQRSFSLGAARPAQARLRPACHRMFTTLTSTLHRPNRINAWEPGTQLESVVVTKCYASSEVELSIAHLLITTCKVKEGSNYVLYQNIMMLRVTSKT